MEEDGERRYQVRDKQDPNPPPTVDPTAAANRAVDAATAQWRRDLAATIRLIETRLDGMDKATEMRITTLDRIPEETALLVAHLRELVGERFDSVNMRFDERDTRVTQQQVSSKEALDAALLAAKELVNSQNVSNAAAAEKTEASFTKQIGQIGDLIANGAVATAQQIADLKERIDRSEGRGAGINVGWGYLVAGVTLIAAIIAIVATIRPA